MQPSQSNDQSIGQELKHDTKSIGNAAANRLHTELDSRKEDGISQIQEISSALKKTAGELGENSPNWLKSAIEQGAEQITKFADSLEQKDSRELVGDVRSFAQQSPGTFLAACAAAGFAASRIFMSGAPQDDEQQSRNDNFGADFSSVSSAEPISPAYQDMPA